MTKKLGTAVVILAAVLPMAGVAGCGSDSSPEAADALAAETRPYPWLKGPSREFLVPGGDNTVPTFGREGTPRERAEASKMIAAWLRVRAAKDWKRDCSFFSRAYAGFITRDAHGASGGEVRSCPEALEFFKKEVGSFANTLGGTIGSLRVGEGQGTSGHIGRFAWAQYHGTDGKDWVVPLEWERGEWKIAKSAPLQSQR